MSSVRRSLLLSIADSYLGLVLQLASTVIISRLLTPAEVGVFAIAAVFAALASTFRDFGVAEYLIQEKDLTRDRIRAALAVNIMVSWSMAALLLLAAAPAGTFYRESGVREVMMVQAVNFLLIPFGAVTQAWFRRQLDFRPVMICNVLANVSAFVVAIWLAYAGFGYMALAWSSLVGIVVSVLATSWFRPKDFPLWPGLRGAAQVFHFGKFASLIYIFQQLGKGAPELIIGRALGAAEVGMYSRGNGLLEMFNRVLLRPVLLVCMPYFASQDRASGSIAPAYRSSIALLTAVGWPFLAVMAVLAFAAIRLVYGPQWMQAVPLAQVLCLACAVELLFVPSREALLASGRARQASVLQTQIVALQVLGLAAVVPFGLQGACWGVVAASVGGVVLSQWHLRFAGIATLDLARACLPSLWLAAVAALPLLIGSWWWPLGEHNYVRWAVAGGATAVLCWLVMLRALRHPLWAEIESFGRKLHRKFLPAATVE